MSIADADRESVKPSSDRCSGHPTRTPHTKVYDGFRRGRCCCCSLSLSMRLPFLWLMRWVTFRPFTHYTYRKRSGVSSPTRRRDHDRSAVGRPSAPNSACVAALLQPAGRRLVWMKLLEDRTPPACRGGSTVFDRRRAETLEDVR